METTQGTTQKHVGRCHCGDVRFEATMDATTGSRCNCSMCIRTGVLSSIVKPEAFVLLSDPAKLALYVWGSKMVHRYFCKSCGIHVFARGDLVELGGAYVSVNLLCLEDIDPSTVTTGHWDGRHNNWEAGTRSTPWPFRPSA